MPRRRAPRVATCRTRRRLAAVACALWLLGFELLPNLHIALHDQLGAHVHEGDGPAGGGRVQRRGGGGAHHRGGNDHRGRHAHHHGGDDHRGRHAHHHGGHHQASHHHHGPQARTASSDSRAAGSGALLLSEPPAPAHGAHSLAHRGVAVSVPPPALPALAPEPLRPLPRRSDAPCEIPRSRRPEVTRGRGPPSCSRSITATL